jgi:hypothetical protein
MENVNKFVSRQSSMQKGNTLVDNIFYLEEVRSGNQVLLKRESDIPEIIFLNSFRWSLRVIFTGRQTRPNPLIRLNSSLILDNASLNQLLAHVLLEFLAFVNMHRLCSPPSTGKTDWEQEWKAPSKKMRERYPKGETLRQLYGRYWWEGRIETSRAISL